MRGVMIAALVAALPCALGAQDTIPATPKPYELDSIVVEGKPEVRVGPLPGLLLRPEQLPTNVQSADQENLRDTRAQSLTDFMNNWFQSVNVNDYQGNPFQQDVVFRGFTAGPQIGTPQGLSVFFDGVRVNEPFGDIVNWDLVPLNAIAQFDLMPGSNPLYGLNTLGGALSIRTRDGFTDKGLEVSGLGGSWGRAQVQGAMGGSTGNVAGFAALNYFSESGWRDNSPSEVFQGFGRVDYRAGKLRLTGTGLFASNDLVGNGLIPYDMWVQRPENVFSSPDETKNTLGQVAVTGQLFTNSALNITSQLYYRGSNREAVGGDVYTDGFESFSERDAERPPPIESELPYCQYLDADGNGLMDVDPVTFQPIILNEPCERNIQQGEGTPRNGTEGDDFLPPRLGGVVEGTPIGVLSKTALDQNTYGAGLQFNWNFPEHKFMVGGSIDDGKSGYSLSQRLALIDHNRRVYEDPENIDPYYRAAQVDIPVNAFSGRSSTASAFLSETWSPSSNLDITVAARYNHTRVRNTLDTRVMTGRLNGDLHDITNRNVRNPHILCPTMDPASCPDEPIAVAPDLDTLNLTEMDGTEEIYTYEAFNPSLGFSYRPVKWLNLYANVSRGNRAPSVVELGCAFDSTSVNINEGITDGNGNPIPPQYLPRSLVGPTCTLPNALSGDPYLPQIRSTSAEFGARGAFAADRWEWSAAIFRTDLTDDIQFVAASPQRSFFQTVGDTRRQGFEVGLAGGVGRLGVRLNYAYTEATYESGFYMLSPHNSSADFDRNSQPISDRPTGTANVNGIGTYRMIHVEPGANLPGIPRHNGNARLDYQVMREWRIGLNMVAHSESYLRGNENNRHTTGGTDQETPLYERGQDGVIRPGLAVDAGRPFTLPGTVPGFMVFGLTSDVRLSRDIVISLVVNNIFDKDYFTAGRLGTTPFAPSVNGNIGPSGWNYNSEEWTNTSFVAPGAPRGVFLSFQYRFSSGEEVGP